MKYRMLTLLLIICIGGGCSIKKGDFEQTLLRPAVMENHATIQRGEVIGSQLTISGRYGLPEWLLGKVSLTEYFLPKMNCTTYYREDGATVSHTECEQIPPVSVEAKLDAKGGFAGDIVATGEASLLGTGYEVDPESTNMWIEAMKALIQRSEIEKQEKESLYQALENLGNLLKGVGNNE